jgi:chemotaxis protein methyltransferase CheR
MALLRTSDAEAQQLINSFTVNETYFFREDHQFRCLGRALLPEIVTQARSGRPRAHLVCPLLDR